MSIRQSGPANTTKARSQKEVAISHYKLKQRSASDWEGRRAFACMTHTELPAASRNTLLPLRPLVATVKHTTLLLASRMVAFSALQLRQSSRTRKVLPSGEQKCSPTTVSPSTFGGSMAATDHLNESFAAVACLIHTDDRHTDCVKLT